MTLPEVLQMSYIEAQIEGMLEHHKDILLARAYHEGIQPIYLTDRQKEYLDLHTDNQFCLNVTRLVTTALCDELNVIGFDTGETPDADGVKPQAKWFWDVWNKNRMDARQSDVHEKATSESEAFIILDWDNEEKYPVMIFHERFTDSDAQAWEGRWSDLSLQTMEGMTGTGQGVWMVYENDDPNQKALLAVQQWTEINYLDDGRIDSKLRRTLYYPERIERYYYDGYDWLEYQPVQKWVNKDGKPLGIPAIHFKNKNMRPEAWDAIPPQDVINKTWVDILGTSDLAGYPMLAVLGLYPTTDGKPPAEDYSNVWSFGPAQMIGNANSKAGDASISKIEGSDPTPLMETLKDQIMFVAQITGTPSSRFITTAAIASADTLKEQERQLRKRAMNRMILFGDAWKDVMIMARKINNAFGSEELDESVTVETLWKNISSIDELRAEKELGLPEDTLWARMGLSQQQIKSIHSTTEYKIKFEKMLWEGYAAASSNGVTVEAYLRAVGMDEKEIKERLSSMGESIPQNGL